MFAFSLLHLNICLPVVFWCVAVVLSLPRARVFKFAFYLLLFLGGSAFSLVFAKCNQMKGNWVALESDLQFESVVPKEEAFFMDGEIIHGVSWGVDNFSLSACDCAPSGLDLCSVSYLPMSEFIADQMHYGRSIEKGLTLASSVVAVPELTGWRLMFAVSCAVFLVARRKLPRRAPGRYKVLFTD
jgi:hypothetical protein